MALYVNVVEDTTLYPLADLERSALDAIRSLAQKHLTQMGLTASALDPALWITQEMEAEYLTLAYTLWAQLDNLADGFGLDTLPLAQFFPLVKQSIERSRNTYIDVLKALIGKQADSTPVWGEFFFVPDYVPGTGMKPPEAYLVQFGDVRRILNDLGGSSGGEVPLATGMSGGQTFSEILAANGVGTAEKMWLYGETVRRTFNGHLQMDGLVFSDWDDPALDIAPQDRWLKTPKYRPGDHWGCACVVVPYVPNWGAPIPMTIVVEPPVVASAALEMDLRDSAPDITFGEPQSDTEVFIAAMIEEFYAPTQPRDKSGRWTVGGGARPMPLDEAAWQAHRQRLTPLSQQSIDRAFGKGVYGLFGESHATTPTPWPRAPKIKGGKMYDENTVREALKNPRLTSVDPRILYGTQPSIVRHHLDYYMTNAYKVTGRTSADQGSNLNAFPVVWVNKAGRHIILSGHHRAAAALAMGEAFPAIVVHET